MLAVDARNISHSYVFAKRHVAALQGVSLQVNAGEFVAVVGCNGCGKSTLAKHLNVLVELQHGELTVAQLDAADPANLWEIRRHCGMVFQNPDNQFVSTLVEEDLFFGLRNFNVSAAEHAQRVEEALAAVEMSGYGKHNPHQLSGGQKQRVALAGVLALQPDIVVLDEATTMLPPHARSEMLNVVHKLNEQHGTTVVMITHYIEEAIAADRVVVMERGRILACGMPREVLTDAALLAQAGLEPPFAVRLWQDVQRMKAAATQGGASDPQSVGSGVAGNTASFGAVDESSCPLTLHEAADMLAANVSARRCARGKPAVRSVQEDGSCSPSLSVAGENKARVAVDAGALTSTPARADSSVSTSENIGSPASTAAQVTTSAGAGNTESLISLENVSYTYSAEHMEEPFALDGVSLHIHAGEFVGIVGRTGCGKSTLVQLVAGLLEPSAGVVRLAGEDINAAAYDRKELRRRVGVVFQYPEMQLFEQTVRKDIGFGLKQFGLRGGEQDERVNWALSELGFDPADVAEKSPLGLSGGEKRRVAIAGVLAVRPDVLILDEPVAGLDPSGRTALMELLQRLNTQGTTVLMVSHNADCLAEYAHRVVVMEQGCIVRDGTPHDVYEDVTGLQELGIGVGHVRRLAALCEQRGLHVGNPVRYRDLLNALQTL